jgi:hypothetical protein
MLTSPRRIVLLLLVLIALVIHNVFFKKDQIQPPQIGDHCVTAPCILRHADGEPRLRTPEGDLIMGHMIFVEIDGDQTKVYVFGASNGDYAKVEIRRLTAIEKTENWASLNFFENGESLFGCVGTQSMDRDQFLKLLQLHGAAINPSICERPGIKPSV